MKTLVGVHMDVRIDSVVYDAVHLPRKRTDNHSEGESSQRQSHSPQSIERTHKPYKRRGRCRQYKRPIESLQTLAGMRTGFRIEFIGCKAVRLTWIQAVISFRMVYVPTSISFVIVHRTPTQADSRSDDTNIKGNGAVVCRYAYGLHKGNCIHVYRFNCTL